ncbi:MAG: S-layer homology domain-containing protein [Clostridiales bacterium]|nr:MAG: S-layer homology domain-containing protein [Clostridiales bacterium]
MQTADFSDVSASDWFYESVCSAKSAGIITGYDGIFNPNGFITREDASVIINRILNLSADKNAVFSDADEISDYAVQAVNALYENKILSGYSDSTFKPKGNITGQRPRR